MDTLICIVALLIWIVGAASVKDGLDANKNYTAWKYEGWFIKFIVPFSWPVWILWAALYRIAKG